MELAGFADIDYDGGGGGWVLGVGADLGRELAWVLGGLMEGWGGLLLRSCRFCLVLLRGLERKLRRELVQISSYPGVLLRR